MMLSHGPTFLTSSHNLSIAAATRFPTSRRLSGGKSLIHYHLSIARSTPSLFKHVKCFISDPSSRPSNHPQNKDFSRSDGHAMFSTSAGSDQQKKTSVVDTSRENIPNKKILAILAKCLWMKDNPEFGLRVIVALGFLVRAKVLNVQVPFLFKLVVDWLTSASGNASSLSAFTAANSTALALFISLLAVLFGYGVARAGASAFNELRSAVFPKVALRTIRSVSRHVRCFNPFPPKNKLVVHGHYHHIGY